MKKALLYILMCTALNAAAATFNEVVEAALNASPKLQVLARQADAEYLGMKADNSLADPEVSAELLFGKHDNKYNIGVSQGFDWPGVYASRRQMAEAAKAYSEATIAVTRSELRREISQTAYDLLVARELVKLFENTDATLSSLLDSALKQLERGDISILDVNKLRIEAANAASDLNEKREEMALLRGRLAELTGSDEYCDMILSMEGLPTLSIESCATYRERLSETSAQLAEARARKALSRQGVEVARRSSLPGFSLGYRFSREDFQNYHGFTFSMTLPTWSCSPRIKAAQAADVAADFEERATLAALQLQLEKDYRYADNIKRRLDAYGEAISVADNFGLLLQAFKAGQITLTDYITDLNYFIDAQKKLCTLTGEYAAAVFTIENY